MMEFQGWIVMQAHDPNTGKLDRNVDAKIGDIKNLMGLFPKGTHEIGISQMNGNHRVWFLGCYNHTGAIWKKVIDLFEKIAIYAPHSYGVLYFLDDEDESVPEGEFTVFVAKNGRVSRETDAYFELR